MNVTVILSVIGALGTIPKVLKKGTGRLGNKRTCEDYVDYSLITLHYWEWPEYWGESRRLEDICCHSNSSGKPSAEETF